MTIRILIVEDEPAIAVALQDDLELEGYAVQVEENGRTAVEVALEESFDLVILDVMLPGKSGYDVCRELRIKQPRLPILMLTARAGEAEKVLGLDVGADDYVTKPFSPLELRARIKALLRRTSSVKATRITLGSVSLDLERLEVRVADQPVDLTNLEFRILAALMQNEGRVLSRSELMDMAWGSEVVVSDRAIDTHIANLRKKMDCDVIESVRGMGYRFLA
jgi:DNA-binding response OmpR family regulator